MNYIILFVVALLLTFLLTVLILRKLIPILKSKKMGQTILEIGPRWHKSKEGTPTMGGVSFILASIITGFLGCIYIIVVDGITVTLPFMFTLAFAVAAGIIGCIDDSAKLKKKQNEGLTALQKYALQFLVSGIYLVAMTIVCRRFSTVMFIPFLGKSVDFGVFYYIICMILLTGFLNAVNLTDGIDGLCSSITLVFGIFVAVAAYVTGGMSPDGGTVLLGAIMIGGTGGFLVYNFYPARVFMGDTGSLFLGALVVGAGFILNNPLIVIIPGIVYIIETLSVILQVLYFKITHGKRLFKMSPIHHHFEKCGWSEIKIVIVFTLVTVVFSVVAVLFGLK
jgi:phospho-N-acetylmuramoyl-pentapeptide-transferase